MDEERLMARRSVAKTNGKIMQPEYEAVTMLPSKERSDDYDCLEH